MKIGLAPRAEGRGRAGAGRLDGRLPGAAEPERNDHAGVNVDDAIPPASRAAPSSRPPASASARSRSTLLLAPRPRAPRSPETYRGLAGFPHHPPKAKRVIFLYMSGGPSHLETFDYKPKLDELDGKPMPESFTKGQPIAQLQGQKLKVQGQLTKFKQHGKSGQWVSDFLPYHAKFADDIAIIRSMVTDQINHDPAHTVMNTGTAISGRPSMGSWVTYGLGSEADDLPGFVVMTSFAGRNPQPISQRMWGNGFLPGRFQGVEFNSTGDPVYYLRNPKGVSGDQQRDLVDAVGELDRHRNATRAEPGGRHAHRRSTRWRSGCRRACRS